MGCCREHQGWEGAFYPPRAGRGVLLGSSSGRDPGSGATVPGSWRPPPARPTRPVTHGPAPRPAPSALGPNVVPISERPTAALEGAPGHWEGDLIIGARNQSAALTLVERSSGFQIVYALPNGYHADLVIATLVHWVQTTPAEMCAALTWDRGSEMAHWEVLTNGWGLPVFFCDAHSPWQRPKNENSNRQLRFWFPKGTDLRTFSQADYCLLYTSDAADERSSVDLGGRRIIKTKKQ